MSDDDLVGELRVVASNLDPKELKALYLRVEEVCFSPEASIQQLCCQQLWSPVQNHLANLRYGGMSYGEKVLETHNALFFAATYAASLRALNSGLVRNIESLFSDLPDPFKERLFSLEILDENVSQLQRLFRMAMRFAWITMVSREASLPVVVLRAESPDSLELPAFCPRSDSDFAKLGLRANQLALSCFKQDRRSRVEKFDDCASDLWNQSFCYIDLFKSLHEQEDH